MFWSLVIEPTKKYASVVKKSFCVTMATLDVATVEKDTGIYPVHVEVDSHNAIVCNLSKNLHPQFPLQLQFEEGSNVTFQTTGTATIHLTGYLTSHPDYFDMASESESESDDLECPPSNPKKRKSNSTSLQVTKKGKTTNVEEDGNELDSDVTCSTLDSSELDVTNAGEPMLTDDDDDDDSIGELDDIDIEDSDDDSEEDEESDEEDDEDESDTDENEQSDTKVTKDAGNVVLTSAQSSKQIGSNKKPNNQSMIKKTIVNGNTPQKNDKPSANTPHSGKKSNNSKTPNKETPKQAKTPNKEKTNKNVNDKTSNKETPQPPKPTNNQTPNKKKNKKSNTFNKGTPNTFNKRTPSKAMN